VTAAPRAPMRVISRKALRKRHAEAQRAYRAKAKARYLEALRMLETIRDDAPITIVGKAAG
jgi:hypothetical protein